MFETFPNASGQIAVNGYISTASRLGLWIQQNEYIRLTADGTAVVTNAESVPEKAKQKVVEIKYRDFLGYDVLFQLLNDKPCDLDDIRDHLRQKLDLDWKSKNQASFRVNWLRSLGYVEKVGKEYHLTSSGKEVFQKLQHGAIVDPIVDPTPPNPIAVTSSLLLTEANRIVELLTKAATNGGDGKEFEEVTEAAFKFLGFETQLISGPGNPDVLVTAAMGEQSYRVLLDSKGRTSGVVQQNDVNFLVLEKQKQSASADYVAIVGASFAKGQLEEFAEKNLVRLVSTSDLRELLLAHSESAFPLDLLRAFFQGGGATDEGVLSEILTGAESRFDVMSLARKVFSAVKDYQDKAAAIHTDSIFYILKCEHPLSNIKLTVDFLKSDFIGALGETDKGSLYTRISAVTLRNKLSQITNMWN